MWYDELFSEMECYANEEQAAKMSAYMKGMFKFLGIPRPTLKKTIKPYMNSTKRAEIDWDFIWSCWEKDYREYQYVAIEYLNVHIKELTDKDLHRIKKLVTMRSWWETVDSLDGIVGSILLKNRKLESVMLEWSMDDNIWVRRVAIDFQQRYKDKTNTELLSQIIANNFQSNEFFINKAIGWSLREYSKTDSQWVRNFLKEYRDKMDKLSIKEASKYL